MCRCVCPPPQNQADITISLIWRKLKQECFDEVQFNSLTGALHRGHKKLKPATVNRCTLVPSNQHRDTNRCTLVPSNQHRDTNRLDTHSI